MSNTNFSQKFLLPNCYENEHCNCFEILKNKFVKKDDENYIKKTLEWLLEESSTIQQHVVKDLCFNTRYYEYTSAYILTCAYTHVLNTINIFIEKISTQYPNELKKITIQLNEGNRIIKLEDFLTITKNVCASYNEMIKLLTKPNDFISVFKMLEIVYVHIECIKPLDQILDSLLILSCIN